MRLVHFFCLLLVLGGSILICSGGRTLASDPPPPKTVSNPRSPLATTVDPTMTDIHDIKPLERIVVLGKWLSYLLAGLALLLLLAFGLWLLRRKRRQPAQETLPPPVPPDVIALEALAQLAADQKGLIDRQAFYFRLSAILRQYIDQRYTLGASRMTTEEFVPRVATLELEPALQRPLIDLCRGADPIKFAKAAVDDLKMQADLRFVEQFVKRTTPHV